MKKICLLLLLTAALSSCVKDVVLDAKEDPVLALACILNQDSLQTLLISWTKGASQTEAPRVTEATAVLTDLTEGREVGRFVRTSEKNWQLEYAAVPTHSYRIEVIVPGHDPVWAEQTMPEGVPFYAEAWNWNLGMDLDVDRFTSHISWVEGITFGEVIAGGMFYGFHSPYAVWITGYYLDVKSGLYIPVKELCTDNPYVDNSNLTGGFLASAGVPEYLNTPDLRTGTYVENYLVGYPYHRDYLRIPKGDDHKRICYGIDGDFKGRDNTLDNVLFFAAMSDDYDRYLCEAYMQLSAEQSSDISSIYLRDNIYTNIHGGLGIFGAVVTAYDYLILPRVRIQVFGPNYDPDKK